MMCTRRESYEVKTEVIMESLAPGQIETRASAKLNGNSKVVWHERITFCSRE
jgi:hypothetical protein